jgi:hypothetical protein
MKTVGHKLEKFVVTGVKPGQPEDAFFDITEESFAGKFTIQKILHLYAQQKLLRMTS